MTVDQARSLDERARAGAEALLGRPVREPRNPEDDVIARIDALVDEQLARGERAGADAGRCRLCGGAWHGLTGDGPPVLDVNGHPGAEGYVQIGNGGAPGCPGAGATAEQEAAWLDQADGWYRDAGYPLADQHTYVDQIDGIRRHPPAAGGATGPPAWLLNMLAQIGRQLDDLLGRGEQGPGVFIPEHFAGAPSPVGTLLTGRISFIDQNGQVRTERAADYLPADAPGWASLPAALTDENLAAAGFRDLGYLAEIVEAPLYDDVILAFQQGAWRPTPRDQIVEPAGSGPDGGWTLDDLHRLREWIWAHRPTAWSTSAAGHSLRCAQCRRHLEPDHALVAAPGAGLGADGAIWCSDCADNHRDARRRAQARAAGA